MTVPGTRTDSDAALAAVQAPAFVGRAAEGAELAAALTRPPAVVLLEGEAGAGKSRLIQEFLGSAGPARQRVLLGICPPFRESQTLGPIVDAVRQACDTPTGLALSDLAGALRPMFPEWGDCLPAAPELLPDAGAARHRLFRALAELVEAMGTAVLIVEDVHWADDGTLEFLLFLAARTHSRLSMVVSYRPEDVPARSLLRRLSSRLPAGITQVRVTLAPLDLPGTTIMASSMLGHGPLADSFARFLHDVTDGLPLAVEEFVRLLRNRTDLRFHNGEWVRRRQTAPQVPPSVRDSVLERVHRLAPDARAVLRAASVLAEPVDEAVVQAVTGLTEEPMLAGLADAVTSGLLLEDERGRIKYRHVLMGAAVYDAIPGSERRRLHGGAGRALEAIDPPPLAQLARHFRAAGDALRWCHYADLAADQAMAAADHTRAVTLLADLLITSPPEPVARVRLAGKMAAAAADRRDPVDDLHSRVIDTVRDILGTPGLATADRARLRSRLSRLLMQNDAYDAAYAELHAVVDDLDDPIEAARAMTYLGFPYTWPWPAEVHLDWLRRAAVVSATVPSTVDHLELTSDLVTALLLLGEPSGWELAATLPTDASSAEERLAIARGQSNIAQVAITWGRYGDADRRLALSLDLADADQFRRVRRATLIARVRLDWLTGRWKSLPSLIAELAEPDETDPRDRLDSVGVVAAQLGAATGSAADGRQRLDTVRQVARSRGMLDFWLEVTAALARLQMAATLVSDVLAVTDEPMRTVATKGIWVWATDLVPVRVEALIHAGHVDEAGRLVRDMSRGLRGRAAPGPRAALATCRALLAEARGGSDAGYAYGRAAAAWNRLPRPYDALLLRERQGVHLMSAGEGDAGLAVLSSVYEGLTELGGQTDADRVARLLTTYGAPPPRRWRGGRRGYGDRLSPREREVVHLVVAGRTNREIAAALSRSPHTVAKQLHSAMRKLGVGSRTALAVSAVNIGESEL